MNGSGDLTGKQEADEGQEGEVRLEGRGSF
jgi:hypothetical protein